MVSARQIKVDKGVYDGTQRKVQGQRKVHMVWGFLLLSICKYGVRWASVIMDDTLDTVRRYFRAWVGLIGGSKAFSRAFGAGAATGSGRDFTSSVVEEHIYLIRRCWCGIWWVCE